MLSNTQQLDLCQYMKKYENDHFFQNCSNFFCPPPPPPAEFGEGVVTHSPNLYFIYNLLQLTTMQNMKCLSFLEVF